MVSAKDFKVGDLVLFKDNPLLSGNNLYHEFLNQLCVVTDTDPIYANNGGDEYDLIAVRCLASGKTVEAYAHRFVKPEEQADE